MKRVYSIRCYGTICLIGILSLGTQAYGKESAKVFDNYSHFDHNGDASYRLILKDGQELRVVIKDTIDSKDCFSFEMKSIRRVVIDSKDTKGSDDKPETRREIRGEINVTNKALAPVIHQK